MMTFILGFMFAVFGIFILTKGLKITYREMRGDNLRSRSKSPTVLKMGGSGSAKLGHNNRGEYLIYHPNGTVSTDIHQLLRNPRVQEDIRKAGRLYKALVLKALLTGEKPPRQYGDFLPMNKERLLAEWDDDWQAVMDDVGLDYNEFFGIREEPIWSDEDIEKTKNAYGANLTPEEIAATYVEKQKERTSKSTIRGYAGSNRSLRL